MGAVKWVVYSVLTSVLIWKRDGFWISLFFGAVVNAVAAKILKRILRSPRPDMSVKTDPGMPSSHAHMLSYFSAFAHLTGHPEISLGSYLFTVLVSYERVSRGIHSTEQCAVGVLTGSVGAYLWIASGAHELILALDQSILLAKDDWRVSVGLSTMVIAFSLILSRHGRMFSGNYDDLTPKPSDAKDVLQSD